MGESFGNDTVAWQPGEPVEVKEYDPEEDAGLVVAVENEIYALDPKTGKKFFIDRRPNYISDFQIHDDQLFDSGRNKAVCLTLSGEKIADRGDWTEALASHNGQLHDAGLYRNVYRTIEDEQVVELTANLISALVSHDDELYHESAYGGHCVYQTMQKEKIAERGHPIEALASHNGRLFDAGYESDMGQVYRTLDEEQVAERDDRVKALASYNGELIDAGFYDTIYRTLDDKPLCSHGFDETIRAVETVPRRLWERLTAEGEVVG